MKPSDAQTPARRPGLRRRIARIAAVLAWLNLTTLLAIWLVVLAAEPSWWPVALYVYSPRWIWGLPTIALVPIALATRFRTLVPLVLAVVVVAIPIMGFRPPALGFGKKATESAAVRVRVLTCDMGQGFVDVQALAALVKNEVIDVALFQGAVLARDRFDEIFPVAQGWQFIDGGEWLDLNLVVATRFPVRNMSFLDHASMGASGVAARYDLEIRGSLVRFINLQTPSPRAGLVALKERMFGGVSEFVETIAAQRRAVKSLRNWIGHGEIPLIAAGNFNLTDDSPVYRSGWRGFENAHAAAGRGFGYTSQLLGAGVRIDHILAGPGWRTNWCRVGPEIGMAHRPVAAELEWAGPRAVFPVKE